jgi:hypothetical protein
MKATTRRKLDMANRVQGFCRAHPAVDPGYSTVLAHFEDCLTRAEQLAKTQLGGLVAVHASTAHRQQLRRAVQDQLRHLARVGVLAAKTQPELAGHFRLPRINANSQVYRTAARAALDEAVARRDLLLAHGMASSLIDDLTAALTQYDEAVEQARAGRQTHVGAVAELAAVTAELMDMVGYFDGLNRYRFRNDAELRAAWASARNIVGPSRGAPPAGGSSGAGDGTNVQPAA